MKFLIVLASVLLAASAKSVSEQWQEFKVQHGRTYKSMVEETRRFAIFQDNLNKIEQHNVKYENGGSSFKMGVNQFADLTLDEFRSRLIRSNVTRPNSGITFRSGIVDVPSSIDWVSKGAVTGVKDQGDCGSCYAFAGIAAIEGAYYLQTGDLVNFSEQQIVDCSTVNEGCDGGWSQAVFEYVAQHGIAKYDEYKYVAKKQSCKQDSGSVKVSSFVDVPHDENSLKEAVGSVGPIAIGIYADEMMFYESGVFDASCSGEIDHEVLLVGYGKSDGKDYWRFKNSWGTEWGEKGYAKVIRNGQSVCGIADDASYPVM